MMALPAWRPSPRQAFAQRVQRLTRLFEGPALLPSGSARPRNFPHNPYPFRAESHFLYLIGVPLQGAALLLSKGQATLYVHPPDPDAALWLGPAPSLSELAQRCEMDVRPLGTLPSLPKETATLGPQDPSAAQLLCETLGRSDLRPTADDRRFAEAIVSLRLTYDAAAVHQLRQAIEVTTLAHRAGMRAATTAKREADVVGAMRAVMTSAMMEEAYAPIVTVQGQILHQHRHDGWIEPGNLLLVDVGAETPEGWAADITRTWPVNGHFDTAQRELYQVVLGAQEAAIALVRPGVEFRSIHQQASRLMLEGLRDLGIFKGDVAELLAAGAGDVFFPHGLGHLLGLDVHDMEDLGDLAGYAPGRSRSPHGNERYLRLDRALLEGMVVTIEPGFYQVPELLAQTKQSRLSSLIDWQRLEQFTHVRGIRIEDDVLVTKEGAEVLSQRLPKQIDALECSVADPSFSSLPAEPVT